MYARYQELLNEKGVTNYKVAKETGISQSTLSDWKNNRSTPKNDKLQLIADYFNVSLDYLVCNTDIRNFNTSPDLINSKIDSFTNKDHRDISQIMNNVLKELDSSEALMFDGEVLDDETRELLKDSLLNSLKMGKLVAKKKYTPKKYRK